MTGMLPYSRKGDYILTVKKYYVSANTGLASLISARKLNQKSSTG